MTPVDRTIEIPRTGASWRHLGGKGKYHLVADGASRTVCGRDVPDDARISAHTTIGCHRCTTRRPDLVEAAAEARKVLSDQINGVRREQLEAVRAGNFVVFRCRKCGAQHARPGVGAGVPFCMDAGHPADLERVDAKGPAWKDPES